MLENIDPGLIKIRAHHLLCLQGFQGYGYDQDFTSGMEKILQILKSDPSPKIEIIKEADDICKICPNLSEDQCVNYSKIKQMDSNILNCISLKEKHILTFKSALQIIDQELCSETVKTVCEDCIWIDKCLFFINKFNSTV